MIETTNTKAFVRLKEGRLSFRVIGKPEKVPAGKVTKRVWKLLPDVAEIAEPIEYHVMPWDSREILLAVGGVPDKDNPTNVTWDDDKVDGRAFSADVKYVEEGLNQTTGKPYSKMKLTNFEQEVSF